MPPEMVAELTDHEPAGFQVWPENMAIVDAFLCIATQWNATSLPDGRLHYHGLRYADADRGLARAGVTTSPADWSRVRLMERAAAAALNGVRG